MGFKEKLISIVGPDYVSDSPDICRAYAYNTFLSHKFSKPPEIVCQPQNVEQVSAVIKAANQYKVPVTPKGLVGGTGQGGFHHGGLLLDLMYMDKILSVDPVGMKAVAEAGASYFKLSQEVFRAGMMIPTTEYSCGPNVAGSVLAPVVSFGKTRYGRNCDVVEGLEVVLPNGDICRVGSMAYADKGFGPFYRYVHGPDLVGMFVMANGAYGIVTKVAFGCQKRPPFWDSTFYYWTEEQADEMAEYMLEATAMEVFDIHLNDRWKFDTLFTDPNGVTHHELNFLLNKYPRDAYFFMVNTFNGFSQEEVDAKRAQMDALCEKYHGGKMGSEIADTLMGNFPTMHAPTVISNQIMKPMYDMNKSNYHFIADSLIYPTSRFGEVFREIKKYYAKYGFWGYPCPAILDAFPMKGEAICSQTWSYIDTRSDQLDRLITCREDFREWFGALGGVHEEHMPPVTPAYHWANQKSDYELIRTIKRALDPNNIMSPGTFEMEV